MGNEITGSMTSFESIEEALECYCDLENIWRNEAATEYWNTSASVSRDEFIEQHVFRCRQLLSVS